MQAFVIINNIGIVINADVNAKNWLSKVDVMMDLFGILVYLNMNVVNCNIGEYLDYKICKCSKKLIDKLVEECSEDNDENIMIHNATLNDYKKVNKFCIISIVLLIIMLMIIIGIVSACLHFYLNRKKKIFMYCINLTAIYVKLLHYSKIKVSEGIDINKSNKWKECMICHSWYYVAINYKFKPYVCNGCHDVSVLN